MKSTAFEEVTRNGYIGCGDFPLGLGWQTRPGPTRKGVGLVITDVTDGLGGRHVAHPTERERRPACSVAFPVKRRLPPLSLDDTPAVRKPELGARVAAILDEGEVVAV